MKPHVELTHGGNQILHKVEQLLASGPSRNFSVLMLIRDPQGRVRYAETTCDGQIAELGRVDVLQKHLEWTAQLLAVRSQAPEGDRKVCEACNQFGAPDSHGLAWCSARHCHVESLDTCVMHNSKEETEHEI